MKKVILCFTFLALVYVGVHEFSSYGKEAMLGDVNTGFNERTILGEKLVFTDNTVDYDNYYVIRFFNDNYIIHYYTYFDNKEAFGKMYSDLGDMVVDYNEDALMIRSVLGTGKMSYYDFYSEGADLFNNGSFSVIY